MSRTSATAASSMTSDWRMSPTINSCSGIDGRAPAGVVLRILALETRGDDVEFGARLRDGGAGFEPRDRLGVVIVPDRAFSVRVCERDQKIPAASPHDAMENRAGITPTME